MLPRGDIVLKWYKPRMTKQISTGVVHKVPADLRKTLISDPKVLAAWEDITPLARNEWICWVESVKKLETRRQHIERIRTELVEGNRRPCCWAGCPHRWNKAVLTLYTWRRRLFLSKRLHCHQWFRNIKCYFYPKGVQWIGWRWCVINILYLALFLPFLLL